MLTKYSTEFKTNVVKAYLEQKSKDPELSVSSFLKCYDPNLNLKSVYNWISSYKIVAGQSLSMSENEIQNKFGTQANEMTLQQKYAIVKETSGMNEEEKGAYCREHGIYASDLQRWDEECNLALANTLFAQSNGADTKQLKSEIKELKQQVTSLQRDCNKKDKEIDRKDKALATYAAKVITLKNFHQLFKEPEED